MALIQWIYNLLWGDLFTITLPGGSELGLSLLVLILIPSGIFFTVRTRFLPFRLFPDMIRITLEKKTSAKTDAISGIQALIISTATRVGMGNLVGVVAAISAGGPGAVFWMWVTALLGSSTAFSEATLAQIYKDPDPLYGGFRGGPAWYIHRFFTKKDRAGEQKALCDCRAVCPLRPPVLVRDQPGHRKLCFLLLCKRVPDSPDLDNPDPRPDSRCDCAAQECHRQGSGFGGSRHGRALFCYYPVYYYQKCGPASGCV